MTRRQVTLTGGPLDGMEFPDPDPESPDPGAYMTVPGEDRRAVYEPHPGEDPAVWHHQGYIG
ncbi:hypothetical protein [Streptosporangium sp. NPDC004631]